MFTVTSDDGKDSAFNAPANMTAEEVGLLMPRFMFLNVPGQSGELPRNVQF